jgi:hypothetical protein
VAQLLAGRIYVNVHTGANGNGEIRGQLTLRSGLHLRARLDGAQEVPPVATTGRGSASLVLTSSGLQYDITAHGLTSAISNAHFHEGAFGVGGGVIQSILASFTGTTATGIWALTPAQIEKLLAGLYYINIHTTTFGNGEIRGQVYPYVGSGFTATLDGAQEVPPTGSAGKGTLAATLVRTPGGWRLEWIATVTGLAGTINNAHFHNEAVGVIGGVVKTILGDFSGNTGAGVWTFADAEPLTVPLVAELLAGRIYVNIHTTSVGNGEIRGQVRLKNGPNFVARMAGAQEVPSVPTSAEGTGAFTLTDAGLRFSITYDGLLGAFAASHIHQAPLGSIGGVVRDLGGDFVGPSASGTWAAGDWEPFEANWIRDLVTGNLYVNVHSTAFGDGEIRGQLGDYAVTGIDPKPNVGLRPTLAAGRPNPFQSATWIRYELPERTSVRLRLLDLQGREVAVLAEGVQEGVREVRLAGGNLAPGVYFLHLATPGYDVSSKVIRIR